MVLFTITLGCSVLCVTGIVLAARLETLVPKKDIILAKGKARVSLDYKQRLLPEHFGLLVSRNQQVKIGITVMEW